MASTRPMSQFPSSLAAPPRLPLGDARHRAGGRSCPASRAPQVPSALREHRDGQLDRHGLGHLGHLGRATPSGSSHASDWRRPPTPAGRDSPLRYSAVEVASRSRSVATTGASLPSTAGSRGGQVRVDSESKTGRCDRCDSSSHRTDRCPHFRKDRENHKDAWDNYGCKGNPHSMGGNGGNFVLRSARVVRQPPDGSCLYHSMAYGLQGGSAASLRQEISRFIEQNPSLKIAGDTLEEWVRWDSRSSVSQYARKMAVGGWGGGIEMAACSQLKRVNVHVYESKGYGSEFKRISCFDFPSASRTIHVLYQGGVHYDALMPSSLS